VRELVYLAAARDDMVGILAYIAEASGSVALANGFVGQLRERCRQLASKPGVLGRGRPELRPDIRSVAHKGYVIFFHYLDDRLEVVNVLEGHRDIDGWFADADGDPG